MRRRRASEGTGIALGLATPLAAATLIGVMTTAIRTVHLPNGPWAADNGYEYNLVLIAAVAALAGMGPGPLSLDARLGTEVHGDRWALAALAAGALGAAGTQQLAAREGAAEEDPA
jgi:putative oxidoreductase